MVIGVQCADYEEVLSMANEIALGKHLVPQSGMNGFHGIKQPDSC